MWVTLQFYDKRLVIPIVLKYHTTVYVYINTVQVHVHIQSDFDQIHLGICLNLKVTITEVTLHSELEDWCAVVLADLGLLGIVSHPHTQVLPTAPTPHIVGQLKPENGENTLLATGPTDSACMYVKLKGT